MQTIKQIASQISNENLISSEIEDLLKRHLNWINVEHEMPELGSEVMIKKTIELGGTNDRGYGVGDLRGNFLSNCTKAKAGE